MSAGASRIWRSSISRSSPLPGSQTRGDSARPSLLFLSPVYPDSKGNGLAMRAGVFLKALAQHYEVTLVIVPLFTRPAISTNSLIEQHTYETLIVPPGRSPGLIRSVRERLDPRPDVVRAFSRSAPDCVAAVKGRRFDVVHALRLYTAPLALAIAEAAGEQRPRLHLDIDDLESATARSLANVWRWNQEPGEAAKRLEEADRFETLERELLPAFDRVYAGSAADAESLRGLTRGDVVMAPNVVRPPEDPVTPLTTHPFTFLFLGNLGYLPNADAARLFCRRIWPLIRAQSRERLRVRIAGSGGELDDLESIEGVRIAGEVEDVTREYADAEAVVVPIRGGGGTRIKVLEAFAHRRPVVSTSMGVEGIEAVPGEHYLLADSPETFADQCLRLMREPQLRAGLAERAYDLVSSRYAIERIVQAVAP